MDLLTKTGLAATDDTGRGVGVSRNVRRPAREGGEQVQGYFARGVRADQTWSGLYPEPEAPP